MKTSDYVVDGFEEYSDDNHFWKKDEEIKSCIVNDFDKDFCI